MLPAGSTLRHRDEPQPREISGPVDNVAGIMNGSTSLDCCARPAEIRAGADIQFSGKQAHASKSCPAKSFHLSISAFRGRQRVMILPDLSVLAKSSCCANCSMQFRTSYFNSVPRNTQNG